MRSRMSGGFICYASAAILVALGLSGTTAKKQEGAPKPFVTGRLALSSDGSKLAFSAWLGLRPESSSAYVDAEPYFIVDLEASTVIKRGPLDWDRPTKDHVLGWSRDDQRVIVLRRWPLGPESTGLDEKHEILTTPLVGDERVAFTRHVPAVPISSGYVSHFTLAGERDGVLFWEDIRDSKQRGDRQQTIHLLDLASGRDMVLGTLPRGWLPVGLCERRDSGDQERQLLVLARHFSDSAGSLFLLQGSRVQMLPVQYGTGVVRAEFLPGGTALAVLRRAEDSEVFHLQIETLAPAGSKPRTVAIRKESLHGLLWAPTGRRLLGWRSCVEGRPLSVVEFPAAKARRVGRRWHGIVAAAWGPTDEEVIVAAEGALWRLDLSTGQSRRIMAIPGKQ